VGKKSGSGTRMNITYHFSESLKKVFLVLNTKNSLMRMRIRDPGWKNSNPGSVTNIPDPQHWDLEQ
jgi:hypothetical protein